MKQGKIVVLFLSLLLPVIIFIFLKSFGKNEFEVAPLFQEVTDVPKDCSFTYEFPYVVADSVMTKFSSSNDSLGLIIFDASFADANKISTQLDYPYKQCSLNLY